jgi:hypothetical protein
MGLLMVEKWRSERDEMVYVTQGCHCFLWFGARAETMSTPNLILPFFPSQRLGIKLTA